MDQDFAHLHQLEVPNSQHSFTTLIKLKNWMRKIYDALNVFVIEGSKTIRLENVHSASILAGQLMDDRPTHVLPKECIDESISQAKMSISG